MLSSLQTILHIHQPFLSALEHLLHGQAAELWSVLTEGLQQPRGTGGATLKEKWKRGLRGALPPRGSARWKARDEGMSQPRKSGLSSMGVEPGLVSHQRAAAQK